MIFGVSISSFFIRHKVQSTSSENHKTVRVVILPHKNLQILHLCFFFVKTQNKYEFLFVRSRCTVVWCEDPSRSPMCGLFLSQRPVWSGNTRPCTILNSTNLQPVCGECNQDMGVENMNSYPETTNVRSISNFYFSSYTMRDWTRDASCKCATACTPKPDDSSWC